MSRKRIQSYIESLRIEEDAFKDRSLKEKIAEERIRFYYFHHLLFLVKCLFDYLSLLFLLKYKSNYSADKKIVYTARNFCTINDGKLEDRIVRPLFTDDIIFIGQSKEHYLDRVNRQKVYNIGGVSKIVSFFMRGNRMMRFFNAYTSVNNSVLKQLRRGTPVYVLWFYELNNLTVSFSKYRDRIHLIEVQHGSIVNYPPYGKKAPIKIVDQFYVKNKPTIKYLQEHLCEGYDVKYDLIPYPKRNNTVMAGTHVFYASTIEFNGLHPVFVKFLESHSISDLHVIVRLHPREREKENMFNAQLEKLNVNYEFDRSKNWLEGNNIANLIVISPWSSTIEDAYDNGFLTITIDPVGADRYQHLIDNKRCFYSNDLSVAIDKLTKGKKNELYEANRSD